MSDAADAVDATAPLMGYCVSGPGWRRADVRTLQNPSQLAVGAHFPLRTCGVRALHFSIRSDIGLIKANNDSY